MKNGLDGSCAKTRALGAFHEGELKVTSTEKPSRLERGRERKAATGNVYEPVRSIDAGTSQKGILAGDDFKFVPGMDRNDVQSVPCEDRGKVKLVPGRGGCLLRKSSPIERHRRRYVYRASGDWGSKEIQCPVDLQGK